MEFREWILERLTPAVMVISSQEAEEMCQKKNGLTVVDMLRPYGFLHQLSVPVRTVGEHAYRIREFRVRFYKADMMFQPPLEAADEYLKGVLNTAAKESHAVEIPDVMAALQSGKGFLADNTPWWNKYLDEFHRILSFGELETFDHPVGCLLVMHAHVDNPVEAFGRLFHSARKPPLMAEGKMEHRLVMHHLLIHGDNVQADGGYARSEEKLKAARAALGTAAVHLIRINSGKGDPASVLGYESLWRAPLPGTLPGGGAGEPPSRPPVPPAGYGACLTKANLDDIKRFLEDFAVRALLPAMEARVRALNHQVTSTRKGLRNQLKTLLWRKQPGGLGAAAGRDSPLGSVHGGSVHGGSAAAASANGSAVPYGGGSVEGQMRALADLAFMMQDYDTALSTLRLLASDLRADKAWKQYAAVQEMIGVSMFMARGTMADVLGAFKEAFYRYNSAAPHEAQPRECVRYATRAMLLAAEYARQHGAYNDANYALMKAHFQEENLRAALLLEQAALCLLRVSPPSVRKYAFHMVLAGLRYNACDQKALGMRAYRQVLSVYKGHKWAFIEEHIHDVLGKQCRDTGDFDAALQHFAAMLHCPHSPPYWQSHYLKQFMETIAAAGKAKGAVPVLELPLPVVDADHVTVQCDNEICHGNPESRAQPEELWRSLEGPLLSGMDIGVASWLDSGGSSSKVSALQLNTAVAGEMIEVLISLGNPLAVDLHISRLRLMFEPEPMPTDAADLQHYAEVLEQTVVLKGGEQVRLALGLRPLQPGLLTLTGVEWLLNGNAPGRKLFAPKRPRHRRTASRAATKAEQQSQCLSFTILDALPRLEASVDQLPPTMLAGEVRKCTLRLRNTGSVALRGIRVVSSSPDVYLPPDNADTSGSTLESLASGRERTAGASALQEPGIRLRRGMTLYTWPAAQALGPGQELQGPLWVHPRDKGQFAFHLAFLSEPAAPVEGMSYRLLRLSHSVDVLPCLHVAAELAASRADLVTFLLRLSMRNMQGLQALTVRQVSCLSEGWRISQLGRRGAHEGASAATPPPSTSVTPVTELPAAAAATTHFRLHPPEAAAASSSPGEEWVQATDGALAHFHTEPTERLQLEAQPEQQFPTRPSKAELRSAAMESPSEPSTSEATQASGPDVMVVWSLPDSAGNPRCIGAHHIYDLQEKEKVAIRATLQGEVRLRHNFRSGGICAAAMHLDLRNCTDAAASLCIETGTGPPSKGEAVWRPSPELATQSSTAGDGAVGASHELPSSSSSGGALPVGARSGSEYIWCGSVRTLVTSLPPGRTTRVTLRVVVMAPGEYEISDYLIRSAFPSVDSLQYSQPGPKFVLRVVDDEG
ncbi:probable trafficking protein particle complex subunit 8 [Coccomyxa sp. Obi]|nr:probable trafficking protein particle complex subunit 8 [Coccomyxa sp. Obi]